MTYLDDEQDDGVLGVDGDGADMLEHTTLGCGLVGTGRRRRGDCLDGRRQNGRRHGSARSGAPEVEVTRRSRRWSGDVQERISGVEVNASGPTPDIYCIREGRKRGLPCVQALQQLSYVRLADGKQQGGCGDRASCDGHRCPGGERCALILPVGALSDKFVAVSACSLSA